MKKILFLSLSLSASLSLCVGVSQAASLHTCPASNTVTALFEARTQNADGKPTRIIINDMATLPGCRSTVLPVAATGIAAMRVMAPAVAAQLGEAPILQGTGEGDQFQIGEIIGSAPATNPVMTPMPFDKNLLSTLQPTVYGAEERAQARIEKGVLTLECNTGTRPAGVVLNAPWYLPRAQMQLQIDASASASFDIAAADATLAVQQSSLAIGRIDNVANEQRTSFELGADGLDRSQWRTWSIACPLSRASLRVSDMRLLPQPAAVMANPSRRSTWVWNAAQWRQTPEQVLAMASKYRIDKLFITVPLAEGKVTDREQLAAFVARAAAAGVGIWAVDGDPHMIAPAQREATLARAQAYVDYNRSAATNARLEGMQFDVEPYLLPGYELAPALMDSQYVELVQALKKVAGAVPLEMVVPFWWTAKRDMLDAIAPAVSGLTVMDYRTDRQQIIDFAIPFLDWSVQHRKQVRIALEAGPIDAELQRRYRAAPAGQLWHMKTGGLNLLLLLKQAHANPVGTAFSLNSTSVVTGAATTFHGDTSKLEAMLPDLDTVFSAWPGYNGIALHEFK